MKSLLLEMSYRLFKGPRKRETRPVFGSIAGIALSMIPLVVVIFLSDGMIRGITDRYIETGTFHIQLRPYETYAEDEWIQIEDSLKGIDQIKSVRREHSGTGLAYNGDLQTAVSVRGLDHSVIEDDNGFRTYIKIIDGRFDLSHINNIVIGKETAAALNLKPDDTIRILTGKTLSTGKYIPKVSKFTVKGIFTTGYQDLDKMWVFVDLQKGMKILQDSESGSKIIVKVADPYEDLNPVISEIRSILGSTGRWGIYSWHSLNRSQQSNYQTTKMLLILIMVLIVLVAVMNISSSMIMLVMENEQEIGILKSMGMNNRFLSFQYVLTAGLAGGTGSFIGIILGTLIVLRFKQIISVLNSTINFFISIWHTISFQIETEPVSLLNSQYYLEDFSINLDFGILSMIFIATLFLSMIAALIPIRNIGKITALDILRKH